MLKASLREAYLKKRQLFASMEKSEAICEKAFRLPALQAARNVMLYISAKSEVNTALLIALLLKEGKSVCAPRVLSKADMEAAYIDGTGFKKGSFGIWEPLGPRAEKIDFIVVPGVAFDDKGNRLGYGKGYYDRFLTKHPAPTLGLGYSCQIHSELPVAPHDKPLDMILTEEALYA